MTDAKLSPPREPSTGSRSAYGDLVEDHYEGIYRFLLHLARDEAHAADLTQETFAAAWQKLDAFEGRSSLGTWLHRIAYGKFIDARRAERRSAALVERLAGRDRQPAADPFDAVCADDQSRQLYRAVERLAPEERAVVVLHYFQGLSYRDMAEVLGEAAGTVKWRTSQALGRLRELLTEGEIGDAQP